MAKILVTGAAGFIGKNFVRLLSPEHSISGIDNFFLGDRNTKGVAEADVRDKGKLGEIFESFKPDYVVHLAAISSAPMFFDGKCSDPREWIDVNKGGFANIMSLAVKHGVKKVVYASTSSIYSGNPFPYSESQAIFPKTFYETTMYSREGLANSYFNMYGLPSVGMRMFAVYGPHEDHKGKYANVISQFLWSMQRGESPILYGDGSQTRDFVFVEDVVSAYKHFLFNGWHGVVNIGTGKETKMADVVNLLNKSMGSNIGPKLVQNPLKAYVERTLADTRLAESLGWKAKVGIEEGIEKLVKQA